MRGVGREDPQARHHGECVGLCGAADLRHDTSVLPLVAGCVPCCLGHAAAHRRLEHVQLALDHPHVRPHSAHHHRRHAQRQDTGRLQRSEAHHRRGRREVRRHICPEQDLCQRNHGLVFIVYCCWCCRLCRDRLIVLLFIIVRSAEPRPHSQQF